MWSSLARTVHKNYFRKERYGTMLDVIPVAIAVFTAQASGRPMSASQLATKLEMPRNTTARRLAALKRMGLVEKHGRAYVVPPHRMNEPLVLKELQNLINLMHDASIALEQAAKMEHISA